VIFYAPAIKFFLKPEETRKKPEVLGRKQYTEEQNVKYFIKTRCIQAIGI